MKIKRFLLAVLVLAVVMLFGGCSKFGIEISELITPPDPTGELYEIRQALYDYAGENITLRYPKSGNWRSAFIIEDIDDNGVNDALAFYSTVSGENTTVMHINLITKLEGKWISVSDNAVESSSIESVEFVDISNDKIPEIVVCWKIASQPIDKMSVYSFSNGGLTRAIHTDSTRYFVCNLDEGAEQELVVIANDGIAKKALATLYRIDRHGVTNLGSCAVDPEVTEYYSAILSKLKSGRPALYIDAAKSTAGTVTEVVFLNERGEVQSLFAENESGTNTATLRASKAGCYDINSDGVFEIPLLTQLPSARGTVESDIVYLTEWQICSEEQGLEYLESALMNYADGYLFKVDDGWKGRFTVTRSGDLTERIFYEYNEGLALATEELFRIKVISKTEFENSGELYSEFFHIASTDSNVFLGRINPESEWKLTELEIRNRFVFITD